MWVSHLSLAMGCNIYVDPHIADGNSCRIVASNETSFDPSVCFVVIFFLASKLIKHTRTLQIEKDIDS